MPYSPNSHILVLSICSMNKLNGGTSEYVFKDTLGAHLPSSSAQSLLDARDNVRSWLKKAKTVEWQGISLSELEYNNTLVRGMEFGGDAPDALYYPALRRYAGRFFQALAPQGQINLFKSKHHVLFMSGLYGLVMPMEPIQLYSCPVYKNSRVERFWTENDVLTDLLISYINEHEIERIFDLTAIRAYRQLISWPKVRQQSKVDVLHAVGSMSAGDDLLIAYGHMARTFLLNASEQKLLDIEPGTKVNATTQDVWFQKTPKPHAGGPREEEPAMLEIADKIERKRRGIIRFLKKLQAETIDEAKKLVGTRVRRLEKLGLITPNEAENMKILLDYRNKVVFKEHELSSKELKEIQSSCHSLDLAVRKRKFRMSDFSKF